jgi:hypothetical protein
MNIYRENFGSAGPNTYLPPVKVKSDPATKQTPERKTKD